MSYPADDFIIGSVAERHKYWRVARSRMPDSSAALNFCILTGCNRYATSVGMWRRNNRWDMAFVDMAYGDERWLPSVLGLQPDRPLFASRVDANDVDELVIVVNEKWCIAGDVSSVRLRSPPEVSVFQVSFMPRVPLFAAPLDVSIQSLSYCATFAEFVAIAADWAEEQLLPECEHLRAIASELGRHQPPRRERKMPQRSASISGRRVATPIDHPQSF